MKFVTKNNLNQNLRNYTNQIVKPLIAKGGGGSNSSTNLMDISKLLENISFFRNSPWVEREGIPIHSSVRRYICIDGECYRNYNYNESGGTHDHMEDYWWNKFAGFHIGFIDKTTNKKYIYLVETENERIDYNNYKIVLFYSNDDMYYNGWETNPEATWPFPSSGNWWNNIHDYTNDLIYVRDLCEASDIYNKELEANDAKGVKAFKTHSSIAGEYDSYFIEGEFTTTERETWNTYFKGYHLGFLNEETGDITPYIDNSETDTYNKVCIYYSNSDTYSGRDGSNDFKLIDVLSNSRPVVENTKGSMVWLSSNNVHDIQNYNDLRRATYDHTFVINRLNEYDEEIKELYTVCDDNQNSSSSVLVKTSAPYGGWELVKAYDTSVNFNPYGIQNIVRTSDGKLLIANYNNYIIKLDPSTNEVTSTEFTGNSGGIVYNYYVSPTTGTIIMCYQIGSASTSEFYRSADNGTTWTKILTNDASTIGSVNFCENGDMIIKASKKGLFYSKNDGVSVSPSNTTTSSAIYDNFLFVEEENRIITADGNAMYVSYNHGETWETVDTTIKPKIIHKLKNGKLILFETGSNYGFNVYKLKNDNDLTSWVQTQAIEEVNYGSYRSYNRIIELPNGEIILSTGHPNKRGVLVSRDGGETFVSNNFEGAMNGSTQIYLINGYVVFSNCESFSPAVKNFKYVNLYESEIL